MNADREERDIRRLLTVPESIFDGWIKYDEDECQKAFWEELIVCALLLISRDSGNPDPMPDVTNDDVGSVYENEVIEIARGDKFVCCDFVLCEFVGRGPVEFRDCKIVMANGSLLFGNHANYIGCHFIFE